MNQTEKRLFLLDGMALAYRAYFALMTNPRLTSKGFNTSAIFGFTNAVISIIRNENPSHFAIAFDTPEPTERHQLFPAYKAQRESIPEDLLASLPHISRVADAFNIPILTAPGYEADDIIGTIARRADEQGFITYMVTPDKDFSQLVNEHTFIYKPGRAGDGTEIMGIPEVLEKWGIQRVEQVIDLLGLAGDASDNIPGIPGIGEKTAQKLIAQFGNIEALVERVSEVKGKLQEKIIAHADQARLCKRLATINCHTPITIELNALAVRDPDRERLQALFQEFEFRTLANRFFGEPAATSAAPDAQPEFALIAESMPAKKESDTQSASASTSLSANAALPPHIKTIVDRPHQYLCVEDEPGRHELLTELLKYEVICFDTETTGLDTKTVELVGIAFAVKPGAGWFVTVPPGTEATRRVLAEFQPLWDDPAKEIIGHNLKYDLSVLYWHGISVRGRLFDTMLAHYLIDPEGRHKMDLLAVNYLSYSPIPIEQLIGPKGKDQKTMREVAPDLITEYAVEDADVTLQLHDLLLPQLQEHNAERVFNEVEIPLIPVLIAMEAEGITVDKAALEEYSRELERDTNELAAAVYAAAGEPFNIDSPKQLGEVLFDRLGLDAKAKKTSKSKQYSTSEATLSLLAPYHKIVRDIMEYRSLMKLKSTYVDTLPEAIFPVTGRVHTQYNQHVAATGRLQSQSPNLQNIPIRTEKGREIRKAFIPRDSNYLLLSADYSQIELRIIAAISQDQAMIAAFASGLDIHQATAAAIYGIALDQVTDEMRRKAKMVNFGIIYGISAFGLAQRLAIPRYEAKRIIENYLNRYTGIKDYMENTAASARQTGYVETLIGRRRYLRDINSANSVVRGAAERVAINAPIQGTAADMIKLAMIKIHRELQAGGFKTKMLIQVHDELLFDLYRDERETVVPMIWKAMETAIPLAVPIVVDVGMGRNWLEAH